MRGGEDTVDNQDVEPICKKMDFRGESEVAVKAVGSHEVWLADLCTSASVVVILSITSALRMHLVIVVWKPPARGLAPAILTGTRRI